MWIFVVLVAATLSSWVLGVEGSTSALIGCTILAIAFVKVRLVGLYFMELRQAPPALRGVFEAYVALTAGTLLVLYLAM